MTDLQKAIAEADRACPCRVGRDSDAPCGFCACSKHEYPHSGNARQKCLWSGHAAIRNVARVAQEGMRERAALTLEPWPQEYGMAPEVIRALAIEEVEHGD